MPARRTCLALLLAVPPPSIPLISFAAPRPNDAELETPVQRRMERWAVHGTRRPVV